MYVATSFSSKQLAKQQKTETLNNPYLTNGFSLLYHLDESTFISRDVRSDF